MEDTVARTCSVEGCERKRHARGYCGFHYKRFRSGKDMHVPWKSKPKVDPKECLIRGCGRKAVSMGLCQSHRRQQKLGQDFRDVKPWQLNDPVCAVNDCGRPTESRGLCATHNYRRRRGVPDWDGPILEQQPRVGNCFVPYCDKKPYAKGICKYHYKLRKTYGLSDERILDLYKNPVCQICGEPEVTSERALSVDHDHSCCPQGSGCNNCVRGLLCAPCNLGIGFFRDNKDLLGSAIAYLASF